MRFVYAFLAFILWVTFLATRIKGGITMNDDAIILSLALVTAGALAGGD